MTKEEIQYEAQSIIQEWGSNDSAPYVEFVEKLASMELPESPSNLDEAVQPEWRKAPISFMGGAIIKTSIGPMYSDHVVAGQLYLKFEELHLLPGYDEN